MATTPTGWGPLKYIPDPVKLAEAAASTAAVPGQMIDALARTTAWVSDYHNWLRVAYVVGGTVIVITGLAFVIFDSGKVTDTATGYAKKAGRAANTYAKSARKQKAPATPKPTGTPASSGPKKAATAAKKTAKKAAVKVAETAVVA